MTSIRDAAADTTRRFGWRVFPTRDKRPLVGSWPRDASVDVDVFDWAGADGYGIALPPGIVVVDIDADATGDRHPGRDQFFSLLGAHYGAERACNTLTALTRSGGMHMFYSADTKGMRQKKLAPLVDTRVGGLGYVVGAGSPGYKWLVSDPQPALIRPFPWPLEGRLR